MNYGFIIDNRKCIGCHACTVACKAEHEIPIGVNRTWVKYVEKGEYPHTRRLFSVMRCNHCAEAPCVTICPTRALYTREDGIVDFDRRRCIGCKACTQACPYDALYIDPETHTAAKCNYCAHRIDIGLEPACVNICPEQAIVSGDLDNPQSEISRLLAREQVTSRKVEKGTVPKLFYIDGDEASLEPQATERSTNYMWNSQSAGVGHFARYAESLIAKSDPLQIARQLPGSELDRPAPADSHDRDSAGLGLPVDDTSPKMVQKAPEVIREKARRVYDAPGKGTLWGWEVTAYVFTKAIAAGALLIPFIALFSGTAAVSDSLQWLGVSLSLGFLALTGILLVMDLDKPLRFAYVLLRPHWTSWLVRGGYTIALYGGMLTLLGLAKFLNWEGLAYFVWWSSAILSMVVAVYTAFLFAQARGRDFWQSPVLPLHMLGHAVVAGAATFAVLDLFFVNDPAWNRYLKLILMIGLVFNLVILLAEILTPHPTRDAKETVNLIVSGPFKILFWGGALLLGIIVPLLLLGIGGTALTAFAGILVLTGIYITEDLWIKAPQQIPLS